jgi:phosphotransferase system enzyme I (PtsI)
VLLLIRLAVKAAKAARKDITACGEMAGTEDNVGLLIGLGIRRVSMAASRIPDVAERISALSVRRCQRLVAGMIQSGDSDEAKTRLDAFLAPFRRN